MFSVTRRTIDDVVVLELKGYASEYNAAKLFRDAATLAVAEGYRKIILDYADATTTIRRFWGP